MSKLIVGFIVSFLFGISIGYSLVSLEVKKQLAPFVKDKEECESNLPRIIEEEFNERFGVE